MVVVAIGVVAVGIALAWAAQCWRPSPGLTTARGQSAGATARVEQAMSAHPRTVSAQITVEELAHATPQPERHAVFAVVDQRGRAVGVLHWDDVIRMPHVERPARLVGDVSRGPVVAKSEVLAAVLDQPAVARAMTAVVVGDGREPVGLLDVRDARRLPASGGPTADEITGSWTVVPSDESRHVVVQEELHGTTPPV